MKQQDRIRHGVGGKNVKWDRARVSSCQNPYPISTLSVSDGLTYNSMASWRVIDWLFIDKSTVRFYCLEMGLRDSVILPLYAIKEWCSTFELDLHAFRIDNFHLPRAPGPPRQRILFCLIDSQTLSLASPSSLRCILACKNSATVFNSSVLNQCTAKRILNYFPFGSFSRAFVIGLCIERQVCSDWLSLSSFPCDLLYRYIIIIASSLRLGSPVSFRTPIYLPSPALPTLVSIFPFRTLLRHCLQTPSTQFP